MDEYRTEQACDEGGSPTRTEGSTTRQKIVGERKGMGEEKREKGSCVRVFVCEGEVGERRKKEDKEKSYIIGREATERGRK